MITVTEKKVGNKRFMVFEMELESPTPSSSGKSLVVGSTHGNIATPLQVDNKPVMLGVNAYIKA